MESVDTKTLVHVGVELVVVGGLTFWFQRKTALQQEEIDRLKEHLAKAEEVINRQGELLAKHDHIIGQLIGGKPHSSLPQPSQVRSRPPTENLGQTSIESKSKQTYFQGNIHATEVNDLEISDEESINDELDDLLQGELGEIQKSRKKSNEDDSESFEVECEGDVCKLKNTKGTTRSVLKKKGQKKKKSKGK